MKLVFIYGPPAVGKLTVAKELLKLTGFKVFHNHLTIDLVKSIFEWGEGPFWELVDRFRLELVKAATEANIPGVIFTFVYAKTHDDGFVRRIVKVVEKGGGEVCFVRLQCERKELLRRLRNPSRREFQKMNKAASLRSLLARFDLFADVPHPNNLVIDNTDLSARRAARMIADHYRLPTGRTR